MAIMQVCKKCGSNDLSSSGKCRPCMAKYMREWTAKNVDRVNAQRRARYAANPEPKRVADEKYRATNQETINEKRRGEAGKRYNEACKLRKREWYLENRKRILEETKARVAAKKAADPDGFRAAVAERARRRREVDPKRKFHERVSALVRSGLKRKGGSKGRVSWENLVGYSRDELERHLKKTIPTGYSWDD